MILFRFFIGTLLFFTALSSAEVIEDMAIQVQPVPVFENSSYITEIFEQIISEEEIYQENSSFESCSLGVEDCAQVYSEQTENMNTPYAPFPWPCDSLEDCAHVYHKPMKNMGVTGIENMSTPYAPFPWPCDSLEDCARVYHKPMKNMGVTGIENMNTHAPFPWPFKDKLGKKPDLR